MFTITITDAFDMKHLGFVVITGAVEGSIESGEVLVDSNECEYITKGLGIIDKKSREEPQNILDIKLEYGDYVIAELIGKKLWSKS